MVSHELQTPWIFPDLPRSRSDLEALRRSRGHVEKEVAAEAIGLGSGDVDSLGSAKLVRFNTYGAIR